MNDLSWCRLIGDGKEDRNSDSASSYIDTAGFQMHNIFLKNS